MLDIGSFGICDFCVVLLFNVPPTAKVILRQGPGLKSHPEQIGEAEDPTCNTWFRRQVVYPLHHGGICGKHILVINKV